MRMIDHMWTRTRIGPYLDGELGGLDLERMSLHLTDCPNCTDQVRWLQDIKLSLVRLGSAGPGSTV